LDDHEEDGDILRGLSILIEDTRAYEQKGDEHSQHEEVLDAEETFIDGHGDLVAA
jgi:hypothetical protein